MDLWWWRIMFWYAWILGLAQVHFDFGFGQNVIIVYRGFTIQKRREGLATGRYTIKKHHWRWLSWNVIFWLYSIDGFIYIPFVREYWIWHFRVATGNNQQLQRYKILQFTEIQCLSQWWPFRAYVILTVTHTVCTLRFIHILFFIKVINSNFRCQALCHAVNISLHVMNGEYAKTSFLHYYPYRTNFEPIYFCRHEYERWYYNKCLHLHECAHRTSYMC